MSMDTRLDLHFAAHRPRRPAAGRRPRGGWGAVSGIVVVAGLAGLAIEGHGLAWLSGLIAGTGAGLGLAVGQGGIGALRRRGPLPRAQRLTEAAVRPLLASGWRFLHDVTGPDGTYDHIAVGPGGLILLESLRPDGVVTMHDGEPVVTPGDAAPGESGPVRRLRPRAVADAGVVREGIQRIAQRRMWVQSVVVFWSDFPAGCVADGRCVYIHGSRLAEWMARRPHQLEEADAEQVLAAVSMLSERAGELHLPVAV